MVASDSIDLTSEVITLSMDLWNLYLTLVGRFH